MTRLLKPHVVSCQTTQFAVNKRQQLTRRFLVAPSSLW